MTQQSEAFDDLAQQAHELRLPAVVTHDRADACADALRKALTLSRKIALVVRVDAGALQQFDSSVLAVLLDCRRAAVAMGLTFRVAHLPDRLRQLAALYGVSDLLSAA
jgi:phospholipid transport system transporter-binding protein